MKHSEASLGARHAPSNWEYANQTAREGATGLVAADVGKFARQLDDNSTWMLTNHSPVTWTGVGGGAPAAHASTHKGDGSDPVDNATTSVSGLMSSSDKTKLDGVEDGADVTDATNVSAAGAVMKSLYDLNTILAADADNNPQPLTVNPSTFVGRKASGPIAAMSPGEARTILNVADGADVTGSNAPQAHASSHHDGGSDELVVEALATAGAVGTVPRAQSDGSLAMEALGSLVQMFQGNDTAGGMTVDATERHIDWNNETIKDTAFTHSTSTNPDEITVNTAGWYNVEVEVNVVTTADTGAMRSNPMVKLQVDTGSGFADLAYETIEYVREDASINLGAGISISTFHEFSAGDKIRVAVYYEDSSTTVASTRANGSRIRMSYIDRTGAASGTVDNLKDVGDVSAAAPGPGAKLFFDTNDSTWKNEPLPVLAYGEVICEDWSPSWADLYAHGPILFANTSLAVTGLVGNATVATINGLTPTANDSYVVTNSGTITLGSVAVTAGAIVVFNGSIWVLVAPGVGGYVMNRIRAQLSTTTALISPYTDGVDDGKVMWFDGTSNTGIETTLDVTITLPATSGLPSQDGMIRRLYLGNLGGSGGHLHIDIASNGTFIDGLKSLDVIRNGEAIMLAAANGSLSQPWVRISGLEDHTQVRRAATWASTNFTTATALPFDTVDKSGNSDIAEWTVSPNPSRIDINYTGHYHFSGIANIDSTGGITWNLECYLRKNGTTEIPGTRIRTGNYGYEDQAIALSVFGIDLEDGDYVEWVFQQTDLTGDLWSATLSVMCRH